MNLTPEQALKNLHTCAESVAMDGPSRDAARASTEVISEALSELVNLKAAAKKSATGKAAKA